MPAVDTWSQYIRAVRRKIEIVRYHEERLLALPYPGAAEEIAIPIQAHFEGLLSCAISAHDQLLGAITRGPRDGVVLSSEKRDMLQNSLNSWSAEQIFVDAKELRDKATHCYYDKTVEGPSISVQSVDHAYVGSRDLLEYSRALVQHLTELERRTDEVETALMNGTHSQGS